MADFKSYITEKKSVDVTNLGELFESLDRQTSHTELRPAQKQSLEALTYNRDKKDTILKISTGAGKTTIGLLYLQSHMEEKEEPAVYLCPTKQLVDQVYQEASKLGIKATIYPAGEPHPHHEGTSAKAVIICTYDKLFNAKTTFDRTDVLLRPCAMVLDDAHAGIEEIKDSYRLRIPDDINNNFIAFFSGSCSKYKKGTWEAILNKDPLASMEIPYWLWRSIIDDITEYLSKFAERQDFMFVWPYLRDILRWCRCIVSGAGTEIIPDIIPICMNKAFYYAKHRLFMSATLADDSILIRELGCSVDAALEPIIPEADKGLGERMVLVPSLVSQDLNRIWVMTICKQLSGKGVRVVILCPNEFMARQWEPYGAHVFMGDDVTNAVAQLKNQTSKLSFVALVQRYDGVDLPDNSCRVLVIDGMPFGESISDKYDNSLVSLSGGTRNTLIYRIEQGMGRAVRSHVDYAVVILAGNDIANFISKNDVVKSMNNDTRLQLKLAQELVKIATETSSDNPSKALLEMLLQCLNRDDGWKQYYDENVKKAPKGNSDINTKKIQMAEADRTAFDLVVKNNTITAISSLKAALNSYDTVSAREKGWYLQRIASYVFETDPSEAFKIQQSAHNKDSNLLCPPSYIVKPVNLNKYESQEILLTWYRSYDNPNGAIASLEDIRARLSFSLKPETIEQAILDLATPLGAKGLRPEKMYGEGPDDLWLWQDLAFVIEAKSENKNSLHKKDSGQLLISLKWFSDNYPTRPKPIPVVVSNATSADDHTGYPDDTRVITEEKMMALINDIESFVSILSSSMPLQIQPKAIADIQANLKLLPEHLLKKYAVYLKK